MAFIKGSHSEPAEWRDAAAMNTADLWLTVQETELIVHELGAVLDPYRGRTLRGERPPDSRRIRVLNVVVPHRRTQPEPGSGVD